MAQPLVDGLRTGLVPDVSALIKNERHLAACYSFECFFTLKIIHFDAFDECTNDPCEQAAENSRVVVVKVK